MAKIYARKIRNGEMSIEQVPEIWKSDVIKLLEMEKLNGK